MNDSTSVMKVSVIVPCYNYGHFLGETLQSVQAQSCADWECLIVDDGSTDDTREVARRFVEKDARFRYLHQPNRGLSAARNRGLREASGNTVQFLDADDLIEPRKLEHHAAYLQAHWDIDIVYGRMPFFALREQNETDAGEVASLHPYLYRPGMVLEIVGEPLHAMVSGRGVAVVRALCRHNIVAVNGPLVRRSVFDEVGFFDEALKSAEDWHLWMRCALIGKSFQFDDEANTAALIRLHSTSMSRDLRRMFSSQLLMRRKIAPLLEQSRWADAEIIRLNREMALQDEASLGIQEGLARNYRKGRRHLLRAAARGRSLKWLAYALVLPLFNQPRIKPLAVRFKIWLALSRDRWRSKSRGLE